VAIMSKTNLMVMILLAVAPMEAADVLNGIGFDQHLGNEIPLNLQFGNEEDQEVALKEYFGKKPVVLVLVYHNCPMLCGAELNGLVTCLRAMKSSVGKEFDVLAVSFDPKDTASISSAKRSEYIQSYHRAGSEQGWHFLTGNIESIEKLTASVGFRYKQDQASGQFIHASAMVLLTPEGKIAKYYYGIEYYPRDLEFGLIEASQGKVGTIADQVLLYCYRYDPASGRYGLVIMNLLKVGGILTIGCLCAFFVVMRRGECIHG